MAIGAVTTPDATIHLASIADLTGRIAEVRVATAESPLGRYRSSLEVQAAVDARDVMALAEVFRAVTEDRDGDARAILDTLDADVLTALAGRAARVTDLATLAARGRRR